jgi:hypothetical protein
MKSVLLNLFHFYTGRKENTFEPLEVPWSEKILPSCDTLMFVERAEGLGLPVVSETVAFWRWRTTGLSLWSKLTFNRLFGGPL